MMIYTAYQAIDNSVVLRSSNKDDLGNHSRRKIDGDISSEVVQRVAIKEKSTSLLHIIICYEWRKLLHNSIDKAKRKQTIKYL